jgi:adenylate cyclase
VTRNQLHDRIVLVGATAASLNDIFYTPYNTEPTAGVEIQANLTSHIISAVLDKRQLIQSWSEPVEVVWLFIWTAIGTVGSWLLRSPPWVGLALLLLSGGFVGGCYLLFLNGWWIPVISPLMGLVTSSIVITGYIAVIEREDRQLVMNLFGRHVSPTVADSHELAQ